MVANADLRRGQRRRGGGGREPGNPEDQDRDEQKPSHGSRKAPRGPRLKEVHQVLTGAGRPSTRRTCSSRSPRRASGTSASIDSGRVGAVREQDEVGAGPDRPLGRRDGEVAPEDRHRVRDRDSVEPEPAQQPVRGRVERRPPLEAEAPVERVPDHDAVGSAPRRPCGTPRPPRAGARARTCGDSSVETRAEPEAREVLRAGGRATRLQPAREGERGSRVCRNGASRAALRRRSRTGPGRRRLRPRAAPAPSPGRRRAPRVGLRNDEAAQLPAAARRRCSRSRPPGRRRRARGGGRGSLRLQSWTITPATPLGAGSPDTTTSAAFCLGVSAGRSVGCWLPPETSSECGLKQRGETHASLD